MRGSNVAGLNGLHLAGDIPTGATLASNGLSTLTRTDLRWSIGIDGRVFITNKRDGVIRELVNLLPGDFNGDGIANGADFLMWQRMPTVGTLAEWESNFGYHTLLAAKQVGSEGRVVAMESSPNISRWLEASLADLLQSEEIKTARLVKIDMEGAEVTVFGR